MSKKIKLIISLCFLIILGISYFLVTRKQERLYQVETNIMETSSYVESVTSIITNSTKLNHILKKHIEEQKIFFYDSIKNTSHVFLIDRDELNIDYKFELLDNKTWSVSLMTSMTGPSFTYPYYRMDCWTWDVKEKKELNIESIVPPTLDFSSIQTQVFEEIKKECASCLSEKSFTKIFTEEFKTFEINETGVTFYFNPFLFEDDYYDIIPISLEINHLALSKEGKKKEETVTKVPHSRIIDPEKPVVALTFDDGPSQYTEKIIRVLEEHEVNATFFILGNKVVAYQDILKRSVQNGNELGNHSYNHKWLSQLSTGELVDQIDKTQKIIQERIGYTPRYLRPTYGSVTNRVRNNTNLEIALWTVDTRDWKIHNIDRIVERATKNIEDGDIILMHDIYERSMEALKEIIPELKKRGFQFVTISELEEVKKLRKLQNEN